MDRIKTRGIGPGSYLVLRFQGFFRLEQHNGVEEITRESINDLTGVLTRKIDKKALRSASRASVIRAAWLLHYRFAVGAKDRMISRLFKVWLATREPDLIDECAWRLGRLCTLAAIFFVGSFATGLAAQQPAGASTIASTLEDAPGSERAVQPSGSEPVQTQSSASIAGTVRDSRGTLLAGVGVTLLGEDNAVDRVVTADDNGAFTFTDLPAGTYRVKINVTGLEPFVSAPVIVGIGETRELAAVAMRVSTKTTTVNVVATVNDVARAQVQQEEEQRILGLLPNYYTSYIWNAAPMMRNLKFNMALRTTTDPVTFLVVAGVAGVEQAHKTFPGYGQGFEGYAKRYGASYADTVSSTMFGGAIFPVLLHQDPRYFYRGSGSIRSRLPLRTGFDRCLQRRQRSPGTELLSCVGELRSSGSLESVSSSARSASGLTFRNGLIITGSGAVVNVLREFLSRKLTPNVPAFANGKP